jgi:hypothetical protein
MNPVIEDIKDKLVAGSVGTLGATSGWGIHLNREPASNESTVTTITLYDTGGAPPVKSMDKSKPELKKSSFQARVRAATDLAAQNKIREIIDLLTTLSPWTVGPNVPDTGDAAVRYTEVVQSTEESFLEKNDNDEFIWTVDFYATRKEKS